MAKKKLGEMLMERGLIDEDQLSAALAYQKQWGQRIGTAMLTKGFITEDQLCQALSDELSIPLCDLSEANLQTEARDLLKADFCETNDLFPISIEQDGRRRMLLCAMSDPLNMTAINEVEFTTSLKLKPVISSPTQIQSAIRHYYLGINTRIPKLSKPSDGSAAHEEEMDLVRSSSPEQAAPQPRPRDAWDTGWQPSEERNLTAEHEAQTNERLDKLERMLLALIRVLATKGQITKEEFNKAVKTVKL